MTQPIEVDTAKLRSAAATVRSTAQELQGVLKKVRPQLDIHADPTWAAVSALRECADRWRAELAELGRRTAAHAQALVTAAANYDEVDLRGSRRVGNRWLPE